MHATIFGVRPSIALLKAAMFSNCSYRTNESILMERRHSTQEPHLPRFSDLNQRAGHLGIFLMGLPVVSEKLETLREFRGSTINVECKPCQRHATFERKALVKQFGATVTFRELRRRLSLGCDRMVDPDGDKCSTRFPCLAQHSGLKK
jgi:hypothetical protein